MGLAELINEKNVIIPLQSTDKESVVREIVEHLSAASCVSNPEIVIKKILDREHMGSTGLDKGIAVPHARTHEVEDLCLALGISYEGIEFNAMDGEVSKLFFMILAPPDQSSQHIRILSEIARISRNKELLESLCKAGTALDVKSLFDQ